MEYIGEYTVYMHVNRKSERKYIGITSQPPNKRWDNGKGYSVYHPIGEAIYRLGFDAFYHVILNEGVSKELAEELEKFYINYFKSYIPKFGYNVALGDERYRLEDYLEYDDQCISYDIDDKLPNFLREKKRVCVKMIWHEFYGKRGRISRSESNMITRKLDNFSFMKRMNTARRFDKYGSQKAWEVV